ncbi:MAG: hypothetical protein V4458_13140 [Pseudomonadota bacterium]
MKTMLLDTVTKDLVLDVAGNIAVASNPYSLAQDAASAVMLRLGELWYDTTQGVPYDQILGRTPNVPYIKAKCVDAALTVPGVIAAVCFIQSISGRRITGQIQVTDQTGKITAAAF